MNREVEIDRFRAKNENGKEYIIIEYGEEIDVTSFDSGGKREYIPGLRRLATSNGLSVNQINPETFQIVSTGETVRKVQ